MIDWKPIDENAKTGKRLLFAYENSHGKWVKVCGQYFSQEYIDEWFEEPEESEPGFYETAYESDDYPNSWRIYPTHYAEINNPLEGL